MKDIIFNINFDDFHPQMDKFGDFGGDPKFGNFKLILELLKEFPGLKITMFTVPNWIDKPFTCSSYYYHIRKLLGMQPVVPNYKDEPFRLDKHKDWCAKVREFIKKDRLEIAVHGYNHHNPKSVIHGQEFAGLSYQESKKKILNAEKIFKKCQIPYVRIFRPPGWGISKGMFEALRDLNYIAATNQSNSKTFQIHKISSGVSDIGGLKNIPQNYSIKDNPNEAFREAKTHGVVYAKGHMVYNYGQEIIENGLNNNINNLQTVLKILNKKYKIKYIFLKNLIGK